MLLKDKMAIHANFIFKEKCNLPQHLWGQVGEIDIVFAYQQDCNSPRLQFLIFAAASGKNEELESQ
jgi:hypothetical protein